MSEATSSPTPNNVPTQGPLLDTPQVLEVLEHPCALIHLQVSVAEQGPAMHAASDELNAVLEQQGVSRISFFTRHRSQTDTHTELELCALIAKPITASGRVLPGTWPGGTYARAIFEGPFDGLPDAWLVFHNWIDAHHLHPIPSANYERYLVGPLTTPDSSQWRTELSVQLDAPNVNG